MEDQKLTTGMPVRFHEKVFSGPWVPYYDSYKGHTFEVVAVHEGDHIELKCTSDPAVKVQGCVHDDELVPL